MTEISYSKLLIATAGKPRAFYVLGSPEGEDHDSTTHNNALSRSNSSSSTPSLVTGGYDVINALMGKEVSERRSAQFVLCLDRESLSFCSVFWTVPEQHPRTKRCAWPN